MDVKQAVFWAEIRPAFFSKLEKELAAEVKRLTEELESAHNVLIDSGNLAQSLRDRLKAAEEVIASGLKWKHLCSIVESGECDVDDVFESAQTLWSLLSKYEGNKE